MNPIINSDSIFMLFFCLFISRLGFNLVDNPGDFLSLAAFAFVALHLHDMAR